MQPTKICSRCGIEKPAEEYHKCKDRKSGLEPQCKICRNLALNEYRLRRIEHYREVDKKYYYAHRSESIRRRRGHYHENKEASNSRAAEYRKVHREQLIKKATEKRRMEPLQQKARIAVRMALKSGRLIKEPCEFCGNSNVVAHHTDYNKPLEVQWLCLKCHLRLHRGTIEI